MKRTEMFHWLPIAVLAMACAPSPTPVAEETPTTLGSLLAEARIVDLTWPYDEETVYWPTATSRFQLEQLAWGETDGGYFYSANAFSTPEHGGTHLDAPIHFFADRWTADEIPLDRLIGPAVVIDASAQAAQDPDYTLTTDDVRAWEAEHGEIAAGSIVLLHTGWGERWPDRLAYLGDDTPGEAGNLHFPSFGADSAQWLISEREVSVLGVDTASIDHGPSSNFSVHRIANEANVPGLENVANLGAVPATGAWVVALPMKIGGGSGAPVRIVALVPAEADPSP